MYKYEVKDDLVFNVTEMEKRDNEIKEKWKTIIIDEKKTNYEISNKGRVRNKNTCTILKPSINNKGYQQTNISVENKSKPVVIHRLVAKAFIKIKKKYRDQNLGFDDLVVNHIDGYKWHNVIYNLEWTTHADNIRHSIKNDLNPQYHRNKNHAKMDKNLAIRCCKMLAKGMKSGYIAEKLNISKRTVIHIKDKETWKDVSKDYIFPKNKKTIPFKISDNDIHKICKMIESGKYKDQQIADKFGLSREYIGNIRRHNYRTNISKLYNF